MRSPRRRSRTAGHSGRDVRSRLAARGCWPRPPPVRPTPFRGGRLIWSCRTAYARLHAAATKHQPAVVGDGSAPAARRLPAKAARGVPTCVGAHPVGARRHGGSWPRHGRTCAASHYSDNMTDLCAPARSIRDSGQDFVLRAPFAFRACAAFFLARRAAALILHPAQRQPPFLRK